MFRRAALLSFDIGYSKLATEGCRCHTFGQVALRSRRGAPERGALCMGAPLATKGPSLSPKVLLYFPLYAYHWAQFPSLKEPLPFPSAIYQARHL